MKKFISLFLSIVLLSLATISCFADNAYTPENNKHNVYTHYHYSEDANVYTSRVSDGIYSLTTTDGIKISVKLSSSDNEKLLVCRKVTETEPEAYSWFVSCTDDYGDKILPFDIYLLDSSGNRVELPENTEISVSLTDDFKTPLVCGLTTDEKIEVLKSTVSDGQIKFKNQSKSYFVITDGNIKVALGDINASGNIDSSDALLALQSSVRLISLDKDETLRADVNSDGNVNALDALLILRYSVSKINSFPTEKK